jgi:O-methyltransferase
MKQLIRRGLEIAGYRATALVPQDVAPWEEAIWRSVREFTMTSIERVLGSIRAAQHVAKHKIPGALVECGVWKGGNAKAMAEGALHEGDFGRALYLYDTYEAGMTDAGMFDLDLLTKASAQAGRSNHWGYAPASLAEVQHLLGSLGLPDDQLKFIKGPVEETIPERVPDQIAVLRLDTDFFGSTLHELEHLYPRLVSGGICIVDDYGHWGGAAKAVDEYFAGRPVFLNRLDYSGRLIVKP